MTPGDILWWLDAQREALEEKERQARTEKPREPAKKAKPSPGSQQPKKTS